MLCGNGVSPLTSSSVEAARRSSPSLGGCNGSKSAVAGRVKRRCGSAASERRSWESAGVPACLPARGWRTILGSRDLSQGTGKRTDEITVRQVSKRVSFPDRRTAWTRVQRWEKRGAHGFPPASRVHPRGGRSIRVPRHTQWTDDATTTRRLTTCCSGWPAPVTHVANGNAMAASATTEQRVSQTYEALRQAYHHALD